jgi:hypothetical protein
MPRTSKIGVAAPRSAARMVPSAVEPTMAKIPASTIKAAMSPTRAQSFGESSLLMMKR